MLDKSDENSDGAGKGYSISTSIRYSEYFYWVLVLVASVSVVLLLVGNGVEYKGGHLCYPFIVTAAFSSFSTVDRISSEDVMYFAFRTRKRASPMT